MLVYSPSAVRMCSRPRRQGVCNVLDLLCGQCYFRLLPCSSAYAHLAPTLPGFFEVRNIHVRGVDVRLWWSNGMSVRAVRGTGEQMAETFTTARGERDNSQTGSISSVHFPGVYSFEG